VEQVKWAKGKNLRKKGNNKKEGTTTLVWSAIQWPAAPHQNCHGLGTIRLIGGRKADKELNLNTEGEGT